MSPCRVSESPRNRCARDVYRHIANYWRSSDPESPNRAANFQPLLIRENFLGNLFRESILDNRGINYALALSNATRRIARRRDNKQADENINVNRDGKFLSRRPRFPSFLYFTPARNSMRRTL